MKLFVFPQFSLSLTTDTFDAQAANGKFNFVTSGVTRSQAQAGSCAISSKYVIAIVWIPLWYDCIHFLFVLDGHSVEQPSLAQGGRCDRLRRGSVVADHQGFRSNRNAAAEFRAGTMSKEEFQKMGALCFLQADDAPSKCFVQVETFPSCLGMHMNERVFPMFENRI